MEEVQYAFINEFGDYLFDFDKQGVSTHLIFTAILVKGSNKERLEEELEFLQEIDVLDDSTMIQIVNELRELPFSIYAYVVDKRKIREDSGIMYQKPFFRYVNRMVYQDLNRSFEQLDLVVNEQAEFLKQFRNYVETKTIPDLFNYSIFGFNQTESDALLRLAHLISGILAKGYDRTHHSIQYRSFYEFIKNKISAIHLLPLDYKNFIFDYKSNSHDAQYNEMIIKQAVNLTYQYLEKHRKSEEEEEKLRMDFLKFLLFNLKENPDEYVYTQEILDNLNALRDVKMNQHYFRSNLVSKLRDSGIIIASSNKGYKLPVCLNDLYDFVNLSSLTIHPMIQRIAKCREQILSATNNEVDILDPTEYEYLRRVIEQGKVGLR
ncbi:hypothetical protein [Neobacillus dielmonensis]|uniref:hypothetical protein n=1 Tax=Neobacillus dielmonensis TaxID=1347369 RepID=UPI0005A88979|nr:hypothetical protein [Neobacillus dielmonensis]